MQRISLTKDVVFSRLIYGMWRLGDDSDTSVAHVTRKIETCLDQGITSFDQADIYGNYGAEAVLGTALRANPALRSRMEIISKCGIVAPIGRFSDVPVKYYDTSKAYIESAVNRSLTDMVTDYIDVLLIHRPNPMMDHIETAAALDGLIASGKVKAVGVSNFSPVEFELLQSAMTNPLVTNQIEVSLGAIEPLTNGQLAYHQRFGMPVMAWSPLGGGDLMTRKGPMGDMLDEMSAKYAVDRAAIAIAWLLALPSQILPVLGTNNLDRIAQISVALNVELSQEDWFALYQSALGHEVP